MRVVVALGGNALLKRGEPMTADVQRANVRTAAPPLAAVASTHQLVLVTAAVAGWATAIAMVGPLLVDLSRELDVPLAQAGLLGAASFGAPRKAASARAIGYSATVEKSEGAMIAFKTPPAAPPIAIAR